MFCRKCGEENPENAVYCRNCGEKLKEEEVKKTEIIEEIPVNDQNSQQTTSTAKSSDNGWIACCCVGLFLIFVLSALFSGF